MIIILIFFQVILGNELPLNFHYGKIENVQKFKEDQKYVFIIKNCSDNINKQFQLLASEFQQNNIVHFYSITSEDEHCKLVLSVYNHDKVYLGKINKEQIKTWIKLIQNEKVVNVEELTPEQKNYLQSSFLFVQKDWYESNQFYFDVLSKLIYPVFTIQGSNQFLEEYLQIQFNENYPIILKQSYTSKLLEVQQNLDLEKKAQFILDNEIPLYINLNDQFKNIFLSLQLPTLFLYVDKDVQNVLSDDKLLKKLRKNFLIVFVNDFNEIKEKQFYQQFLDIQIRNTGVLITFNNGINRYYLEGKMIPKILKNFNLNYQLNNLRSHRLVQKINSKVKLQALNSKKLKKILKNDKIISIIFAHSQKLKKYEKELSYLQKFYNFFKSNKYLQVYTFNKMKNDIDGHYYDEDNFFIIKNFYDHPKIKQLQNKDFDSFYTEMISLIPSVLNKDMKVVKQ